VLGLLGAIYLKIEIVQMEAGLLRK